MTRRCQYCGDPFSPRAYNQKFCNPVCAAMSHAHVSIEDVCHNCGHPRVAHFAGRGGCNLIIAGDPCGCAHFRFKRDV